MAFLSELSEFFGNGQHILIMAGIVLVFYTIYLKIHYMGTPPGPWGLPFIGYYPLFSARPFEDFVKMSRKYGDVFSIKFGQRYVVVLNHYDTIRETYVKEGDIYSGKPKDGLALEFGDHKSVFVTDGDIAREQRRFILSTLRDFGFGKKKMEENIQEEIKMTVEELRQNNGKPFDISRTLSHSVANVISWFIFGHRFGYADKAVSDSIEFVSEIISRESHFHATEAFPILEHIIPTRFSGFDVFKKVKEDTYAFTEKEIEEHKRTFDPNNIRDLTDAYLMKVKQLEKTGQSTERSIFTEDYLKANAILLFAAGTDTTSATLSWFFKYMALNIDVQKKIQKEIDDIIGHERLPETSDRTKMTFTEATILEVGRMISHVPLTFYHRVTEDTNLKGYRLPKDTLIFANLWSVHYDPQIWTEPYKFNPHRFIDSDGKLGKLREYVIPFSVGKRNCLGESLAKMEIFLFVTSLLQKFTFLPTDGDDNLDTITETPTRKLKSCRLSVIPRDQF